MGETLSALEFRPAMATLIGEKTCMITVQFAIYSKLSNFMAS